jgi:hypothetical protein
LCDENGIGGDGEYCGDKDAQLGRIHEAPDGKYVPRAVFFDLRCARFVTRLALPSGKPRVPYARAKLGERPLKRAEHNVF